MRSQHLPMSREDFALLPRKPGWRYEYLWGQAHITPQPYKIRVTRRLVAGRVEGPWVLRSPTEEDIPQLIDLYAVAFADTFDYCDYEPEEVHNQAALEVVKTFGGREYGTFLGYASQVAEVEGRAVGGLLVTEYNGKPHLTYLFVHPAWQRKGLATALVQSASNALLQAGYHELTSTYRPGNEPSRAWHRKFGFTEGIE